MLHEPEYHILYNMYLEVSMSTALNYYGAEFNRLWPKHPLTQKLLMWSPNFPSFSLCMYKGEFRVSWVFITVTLTQISCNKFFFSSPKMGVRQGHSASYFTYKFYKCYNPLFLIVGYVYLKKEDILIFHFNFSFNKWKL